MPVAPAAIYFLVARLNPNTICIRSSALIRHSKGERLYDSKVGVCTINDNS
jgi:hypothetical protein